MALLTKVACPYCYRRFPLSKLAFQCTGWGTPGREGCKPATDEVRTQLTGYTGRTRFTFPGNGRWPLGATKAVCPEDGGETGIRACPECHTPLPPNFGSSASPLIAMVGAKGTGKSVYTTVLAHELRSGLRRRFNADVRLTGDRQGGAESPVAWLDANVRAVFEAGRLPPQTAAAGGGMREPLVFEWRQVRRRAGHESFHTSYLSFYDTAGEDLTLQERVRDQAYLGASDALILLLDPFMLPRARERLGLPGGAVTSNEATIEVLGRLTDMLRESHGIRGRKKIPIPAAIAFAKFDAFMDVLGESHPLCAPSPPDPFYNQAAGRSLHENVRALLHDWGADDIDGHLQSHYKTFRYSAVSALGAQPDYDTRDVDKGGVRPHRVEEPLVWLLSRFNVVDERR
jgi:hypothetical protein